MTILSELQKKKLGLLDLIALGYDLYLKNIRLFLSLNCMALPFFIILIIPQNSANFPNSVNLLFALLNQIFYFFVFVPCYSATVCILVENCVLGEQNQPKNIVDRIIYRIFPLLCLSIRFSLNLFARLLLMIIPGIIYYVNNGFVLFALILRSQTGKSAFQYSRLLIKGNWRRVFFYNLISYMTVFGVLIIFDTIINIIFVGSPSPLLLLAKILSFSLYIFATFGLTISGVLLFLNLEFQKR